MQLPKSSSGLDATAHPRSCAARLTQSGADAGTIAEANVSHMHYCSSMCSLAVAMASESTFSKWTLSVPMLLVTVQLLLAI